MTHRLLGLTTFSDAAKAAGVADSLLRYYMTIEGSGLEWPKTQYGKKNYYSAKELARLLSQVQKMRALGCFSQQRK